MVKPQLKRLFVLIVVVFVVFSIIPAASAYSGKKVKVRSIEDWLLANNLDNDPPMGGMPDWDKELIIWPHLLDNSYSPAGFYKTPLSCSYNGFIIEKRLKDNIILVSINLHIKDAPFLIVTSFVGDLPSSIPIFRGKMDYYYQLQFTIDLETVGPDGYDENGNIKYQPWWWYVWFLFTLESVSLVARGSGEFLTSYQGWEEGDTAKMNTIVIFKVVGPDYTGNNPYYNFNQGLYEIPLVNRIDFH